MRKSIFGIVILAILLFLSYFVSAGGILDILFSPATRPIRVYVHDSNNNPISGATFLS